MQHPDPALLDAIRARGFAVVPGALPAAELPDLKERLERVIHEDLARWGEDHVDRWMVQNLMARDLAFARVLENPVMHAYLSALLMDTCIVYAYTSSSLPPHGANYARRIHVDCPRLIPGYITNVGVMLILDDFTDENGATAFMPGSFTLAEAPSAEAFHASAERVYPRAGDMVVFNARTFHLGGENHTDRPRHALTLNACRSYMRQRFDYPRLVPPAIVAQLGETGRRFLGFNVRMPSSLEEYYLPESERLYKANQG